MMLPRKKREISELFNPTLADLNGFWLPGTLTVLKIPQMTLNGTTVKNLIAINEHRERIENDQDDPELLADDLADTVDHALFLTTEDARHLGQALIDAAGPKPRATRKSESRRSTREAARG